MATDREEFIETGVEELRRLHRAITQSYDAIKVKALALLAGEVAIVTFLFADNSLTRKTPMDVVIYVAIFHFVGIFLLSMAFILFLHVISPVQWRQPPETKIIRHMDEWFGHNREKFLLHMREEYMDAIANCEAKLAAKARRFILAIYFLSIGIVILVLLKYGAGRIQL